MNRAGIVPRPGSVLWTLIGESSGTLILSALDPVPGRVK